MQSELRKIERISEDLDANYHQMQHFITESNWDERSVIDQVSREVSSIPLIRKLTGLIIDESGCVKKGDKSIGVGWQYCGNVRKISDSQIAVFACLSNSDFASMVDSSLYLPKGRCNDPVRCKEAGTPSENRVFETKLELAVDIIHRQIKNGVLFDYGGGYGYYGNDVQLARAIAQMGDIYMLDNYSDQKIILNQPELFLPERQSTKGSVSKRLKASTSDMGDSCYIKSLQSADREKINVSNTVKEKLTREYLFVRIFIWDKSTNQIEPRMLVIQKTMLAKNTVEIKYSFTNANLEQYIHWSLAYMQAQRFFVEHCIKESKQKWNWISFRYASGWHGSIRWC